MKSLLILLFCALALSAAAQPSTTHSDPGPFKPAFWIVDGAKVDTVTMNKKPIDAESIESIHVWKGDSAVARYGETGRAGVIVVITKEAALRPKKKQP
jgi:hypothetical protein